MDYVRFGLRCGMLVSRVAMGTMTFGRESSEEMSFALLDRYRERGGNFLDTADIYTDGEAERIVGRWIKARGVRDEIVLATKVYGATGPGPNQRGLSRLHIQHAVEASLRRLQTDVIDLYQIHRWDPMCSVEETLEALTDLVSQGLVRYIGCSNVAGWQLQKYLDVAAREGLASLVSVQPIFNALNRSSELEVLPIAQAEGLAVMPYNPLAGGMLTGKYRRGEPLPSSARLGELQNYYERFYTDQALNIVELFLQAAAERGVTPAQLAFAWVMADPRVTCPIIGARNLEQFDDTWGALDIEFKEGEREALPAVQPGRWVGTDPVYDRGVGR